LKLPSTEHFKLCQGNNQLISNQGISLDEALALNLDGQIKVIYFAGGKSLTHPFGQLKTRPMPEVEINL
jgi:hypothetical protein